MKREYIFFSFLLQANIKIFLQDIKIVFREELVMFGWQVMERLKRMQS